MGNQAYTSKDIEVLEGLDPVRARPAMYIGSTSQRGLNHLIHEVVDNSVDESLAGYCTHIEVTLKADGSCEVKDNGRGIPVDLHSKGVAAERVILTTLHAGGKFSRTAYATSGGLHGVGLSAVNALSKYLEVEVRRDGKVYKDRYEQGKPTVELKDGLLPVVGDSSETGTTITFLPDDTIFEKTIFKGENVKSRLHETAYLNPQLTIIYRDERKEEIEELIYHEPEGITKYVSELTKDSETLTEPIQFEGEFEDESGKIIVDCAFQYSNIFQEQEYGFCNNISNPEGGTHITGFKTALTTLLNQYARQIGVLKDKDSNFLGTDIRTGLTAIVAVKHPDPRFEGQTKTKLDNQDASRAVAAVTTEKLTWYFDRHLDDLRNILSMAEKAVKIRKQETKSKENILSSKKKFTFDSNGKLANCESRDASKCEIFIVEGDSAGGSAKSGRNRKYQSILPIRGKILNVEKANMSKVLANEEIKSMINAFGCGFGEGYGNDFNIEKLRYDKIIIMCFTGDTKLKSLDGNDYTFQELINKGQKEIWVYSRDKNGNIVPAKAENIRQTGETTQLAYVELDDGQIIKCTPDHLFMDIDGNYVRADELTKGLSLSATYFKDNGDGYPRVYTGKHWELVHRLVGETLMKSEWDDCVQRANDQNIPEDMVNRVGVHHIDRNTHNNSPDNLMWVTHKEHSDQHKELYREVLNKYNYSEKHKEDVRKAHKAGKYKGTGCYFGPYHPYSGSEKNREVARRVNAQPGHQKRAMQGKIGKSIRFLIDNNLPYEEYYYNFYRHGKSPMYDNILDWFDSYQQAYEFAKEREWDYKDYVPAYQFVGYYDKQVKLRNQIGNVVNRIWADGLEFNEETYSSYRGRTTVKYENILMWFDSYEEVIDHAKHMNHKVKSVKIEDVDSQPVYCLSVPTHHNFLLSSGVFVHQCDADSDGAHISALLMTLFYRFFPELVYDGHIYVATSPLYIATYKDGRKDYLLNDEELEKYKQSHTGYTLGRAKGLGELNPDELWETTMNPKTRKLLKVTVEEAEKASYITSLLMGNDVEPRKKYIVDHADGVELDI